MMPKEEDLVSRCGETPITSLTFKLSKCYKFIEELLENKLLQEKLNEVNKHEIEKCFDYIDNLRRETSCIMDSQNLRTNYIQDCIDRTLERIGKLEKLTQKIMEQNKHFSEQLTKILYMCELSDKESQVKASVCPVCDGKGELLNNNPMLYNFKNVLVLRRDSTGNTYESCNMCKGTGVIIK